MFRLDRFLTLYFFYPLLKRRRPEAELKIPILMYHSISDDKENSVHPYYRLNTSPARFAEQMKFLQDNNFRVISLTEAVNLLDQHIDNHLPNQQSIQSLDHTINQSTNQPANYVVLTFDDGYHDFLTQAWPVLRDFEYTATVFLPTALIDEKHKKFKGKQCLTWNEIRELNGSGIGFGSHTVSHPKLFKIDFAAIEYEICESKHNIESETNSVIESFAFPYAFPEQDQRFKITIQGILEKCDYKIGVTTMVGSIKHSDERFFLKRIPINSYDDPFLFSAKLAGAYDWLYYPQRTVKTVKNIFRGACV